MEFKPLDTRFLDENSEDVKRVARLLESLPEPARVALIGSAMVISAMRALKKALRVPGSLEGVPQVVGTTKAKGIRNAPTESQRDERIAKHGGSPVPGTGIRQGVAVGALEGVKAVKK